MHAFATITASVEEALRGVFGPSAPYGPPAILGALALTALSYLGLKRAHGRAPTLRGFRRAIFPRRVVLHPSTRVDLRLWLVNGLILASTYGMLSLGLFAWRDVFDGALGWAFGRPAPLPWPAWTVFAMATILQVLAYDLAYWVAHFILHRVPFFWEFHKVHHSAEVLTPLTELRQHPVEVLLVINLIGFATGLVFGVLTFAFGSGVHPFTLLNGNILMMGFLLTYGHLRHSNLWIPFTGLRAASCTARPITSSITRPIRPILTGTSASRSPCGTGPSARSSFRPRRASR
jgi:sterol desaturase/sphingolipid hydroxylase (fatty acid hydroxylase superfamily)